VPAAFRRAHRKAVFDGTPVFETNGIGRLNSAATQPSALSGSSAVMPSAVIGDATNNAALSDCGQQVWDELINENDQIFLTLDGHYWPPASTTPRNAAGNDVGVHITNYQNRYFGGGGMLRLYHFDLDLNTIDVETISPWVLAQEPAKRNELAARRTG
jgi:hypothetical protein